MIEGLLTTSLTPWAPSIEISSMVSDKQAIRRFIERVNAGYTAPEVIFGPPEALTVMGRHFAVISERDGLVPASVHTIGAFKWHQAFAQVHNIRLLHDCAQPPLIAASSGSHNYYHWTAETIGALLVHRLLFPGTDVPAVVPIITASWQRQAMELFGLPNQLIEVASQEAAVFDHAILTNLTGRDFALCPHPTVLEQFRKQLPLGDMKRSHGKLIYVARLDAAQRRPMTNETDLWAMLERLGFEVIIPGAMSVREQATIFAHAALIVAPHGAALSNLLYCAQGDEGPAIIELHQDDYLSPIYAKLCQAKMLDYCAIINPCTDPADYHHNSAWSADLDLIEKSVARKLDQISARN